MSVARSAAEVLRDHVVLEVEAIDRMYLNVYVPHLQSVGAVVGYLRVHRGQRFASTTAVTPMTTKTARPSAHPIRASIPSAFSQTNRNHIRSTMSPARAARDATSSSTTKACHRAYDARRARHHYNTPAEEPATAPQKRPALSR